MRRACATWRYHHGWDLQDVADLLDDDPKVVEGSYLDRIWLKTAGRKPRGAQPVPAGHVDPARREGDLDTTTRFRGSCRILAGEVKSPSPLPD